MSDRDDGGSARATAPVSRVNFVAALAAARRALEKQAGVSEWVATVAARERVTIGHGDRELVRGSDELELRATVHRDLPGGRGSAELALAEPTPATIAEAVEAAAARASTAVGPTWRLPAPGAPARVALADLAFVRGDLELAAEGLSTLAYAAIRQPALVARASAPVRVVAVTATVERDDVAVVTGQGLDVRWQATAASVRLVLAAGDAVVEVTTRARALADLNIGGLVERAVDRLAAGARATPVKAGRHVIVVRAAALVGDAGGWGLMAALVAQADAALESQGLARYRPGQPMVAGAHEAVEPLTVASDGTLPFGLFSAPLGDGGEPVRRFALIDRGRAAGLGLGARDAALRRQPPNGGVRNLVVPAGPTALAELIAPDGETGVIDVDAFAWIDVDVRTGRFAAGIAAATLRDGAGARPVTGVVRGDLIDALARSRRSRELANQAWYRGPAAWRLPPLDVDP